MNEAKIMQLVDELKAELSKPDEPQGRKLEVGDWVIIFYQKKLIGSIKIESIHNEFISSEGGYDFKIGPCEIFYAPLVNTFTYPHLNIPHISSDYDYCAEHFERAVV
jgi:hypothetical protein